MSEIITFDTNKPDGMLKREINCVALALEKTLKVNTYPLINHLIEKGVIKKPDDLQYSNTIDKVMTCMNILKVCEDKPWSLAKEILKSREGYYFAVNTRMDKFLSPNSKGHAFSVKVFRKSIGIAANNAEVTGESYHKSIKPEYLISIWGPVLIRPYYARAI